MSRGTTGGDASSGEATADQAAHRAAAEIRRQVESERIASLQALIPPTLVGGSAFAVVIAVLLVRFAPPMLVFGWIAAKLAIAAWRAWDVRRYRLVSPRLRAQPEWRTRLFVALGLDSLVWSGLPLLFMPWLDATAVGLLVAATVGVVAVGTFSLSAHRTASAAFLAIVLGPLAVQQLFRGTLFSVVTALSLTLFAAVLLIECERSHKRFSEMVKLRFENAAIAEQRQRALIYAEHSNAAKTRFLASVSHELRTPLNGILGMTQLMEDESLSPMQHRSLQVVRHSAEHLVSVIGDLLDLSRIEMDRISIDPKPTLLAQTVRDVVDLLRPVAVERGLVFLAAVHPSLPKAAVYDAGRVKQVLHNLIGNAIKFTASGEIRVIARLADPQTLSFEVRDTGEGVPPESIDRIFEPFEQASPSPGARGGAGLGLTISRQIARAMGGDVTYRPAPGKGARFRFTLAYVATDVVPAARREQLPNIAPAPPVRPLPPKLPEFADTQPMLPDDLRETRKPVLDRGVGGRVLIVEDNEVNALVVRGMLDQMGVRSDRVTDGRQAIDALYAQGSTSQHPRFDLVLMDCQMPVLDGWAATREWRVHERERGRARHGEGRIGAPQKRMPIIALTASAAAGERERCLAAGMDDYLSKPFSREDLLNAIKPWLSNANPEPELERPATRPARIGGGTPAAGPSPRG
jgi:signal transduction histidine kinase/CheY-like chemotaxis protein